MTKTAPLDTTADRDARASLETFARDSAGLRDFGHDVAVAANRAYWQAKLASLDDQQTELLMTQAQEDLEGIRRAALRAEHEEEVKRSIFADLAAGIVPAILFVGGLWGAAVAMSAVVTYRSVA